MSRASPSLPCSRISSAVANFELLIKRSASKELEALPLKDRRRIVKRIQILARDPRPLQCVKLSGHEQYRLRQGDYRIIYEIDDAARTVTVVKIAHRREAY